MDWKLEFVIMPVSDVDRRKSSTRTRQASTCSSAGHRAGEDFRVVQLTPPESACWVAPLKNPKAAGSVNSLHLVVTDIEAARDALVSRGVEASDFFHFGHQGQTPGLDRQRADHASFLSFSDPDGNSWMVQEVGSRRGPSSG